MSASFCIRKMLILSCFNLCAAVFGSFSVHSETISADLAFSVMCNGGAEGISNERWSAFLMRRGFAVLDKAHLARECGQKALLPRDLVALDPQDREIDILQLPIGSPHQYVSLRSPPPTRHDENLEAALISFASEAPGCRAVEIARHDNDASLRSFHDRLVTMAKGWFQSLKGI